MLAWPSDEVSPSLFCQQVSDVQRTRRQLCGLTLGQMWELGQCKTWAVKQRHGQECLVHGLAGSLSVLVQLPLLRSRPGWQMLPKTVVKYRQHTLQRTQAESRLSRAGMVGGREAPTYVSPMRSHCNSYVRSSASCFQTTHCRVERTYNATPLPRRPTRSCRINEYPCSITSSSWTAHTDFSRTVSSELLVFLIVFPYFLFLCSSLD